MPGRIVMTADDDVELALALVYLGDGRAFR